jgi:undecaprenyl-diphosphatase
VSRNRRAPARGPLVLAVLAATAFVLLTVLVASGATRALDVAARDLFRPHDVWGAVQIRADVVVEGLRPRNTALVLMVVTLVACAHRRSWRPAAFSALVAGVAAALALATKVVVGRSDPHLDMSTAGGSFPSGHTLGVLVCLGTSLLLLSRRPRWWAWAVVGIVTAAMGLALLLEAAHWLTDVLGGVLLGIAVLAGAQGLREVRAS